MMPKKRKSWIRAHSHDHFYKKSKEDGFVSRAAYKLIAIHKKFKIFRQEQTVIDLCCAPGGWLQVIRQLIGEKGKILGIDLTRTRPVVNADFLIGDITKPEIVKQIIDAGFNQSDVIVSDCSPKTSGIVEIDTARQHHLVEQTLEIAKGVLKLRGKMVTKLFQGPHTPEIINKVKKYFTHVNITKPKASPTKSREVYLVGQGFHL